MRGSPRWDAITAVIDWMPPGWSPAAALAALVLVTWPVFGQSEKGAPKADAPATYVGSETCSSCHEDIFKAFKTNRHYTVEADKKRGFDGKACESCHGPGSKHAETTAP